MSVFVFAVRVSVISVNFDMFSFFSLPLVLPIEPMQLKDGVALPSRIMDRIDKFFKSSSLGVGQRPRSLIPSACVDIHLGL